MLTMIFITAERLHGAILNTGNIISGNTVNLKGGTLNLTNYTKDGETTVTSTGSLNLVGLNVSDTGTSTLNAKNDVIQDNINLGNVTLNKDLKLAIEANFTGQTADVINGTYNASDIGNNRIVISEINIVKDGSGVIQDNIAWASMPDGIKVADSGIMNAIRLASDAIINSDDFAINATSPNAKSYLLSYNINTTANQGELKFEFGNLASAVSNASSQKTYNMNQDETVVSLGTLAGDSLSVIGNNHKIVGSGSSTGITVNGNTLSVNG